MILNPASKTSQLYNQSAIEASQVVCAAEAGVEGSFRLTCPAFAGITQADYFTFALPSGTNYAVWFDKDNNGTAPTGAAYVAAGNQIEVDITTGDTAAVVAAAVATALGLVDIDIVDNLDGTLDFTQQTMGDHTAPSRHNADDSGNGSLTLSLVVAGVDSNHLSKYFKVSATDGTTYYVWYDVNSEGVDPAPGGTGLSISVAIADTGATIATAVKSALDGTGKFTVTRNSATLDIVDLAAGSALDINAGTAPDTFYQITEGSSALVYGGTAVSSLSNSPAVIAD